MMPHGWFWCELQDVIKKKTEQCMGVSLEENSLRFEPPCHRGAGAEIMAVSWSRSE